MSLDPEIRRKLTLPAVCAPMFLVSNVALVREACKAGVIGGLPRHNARTEQEFARWLHQIATALDEHRVQNPHARVGPVAVNLRTDSDAEQTRADLDLCVKYGVEIVVSATGDPTELIRRVHDRGLKIFVDVTTVRHAEKAAAAGADGLTCIGSGGGGHSGMVSHLALIPRIRQIFDGTIVLGGAVSTGAVIRAGEVLGADLCYLGTRFIATKESGAPAEYKRQLVENDSTGLRFTTALSRVPANWLAESMRSAGIDPDGVDGRMTDSADGSAARPWVDVWSAGQGIDLIEDVPSVAELVSRLRTEYLAACEADDMADAARLAEQAEQGSRRL